MDSGTLWTSLALLLVIEGLFPLLSPAGWRLMFERILSMSNGQIRFFGLCSIALGLMGLAVLA